MTETPRVVESRKQRSAGEKVALVIQVLSLAVTAYFLVLTLTKFIAFFSLGVPMSKMSLDQYRIYVDGEHYAGFFILALVFFAFSVVLTWDSKVERSRD